MRLLQVVGAIGVLIVAITTFVMLDILPSIHTEVTTPGPWASRSDGRNIFTFLLAQGVCFEGGGRSCAAKVLPSLFPGCLSGSGLCPLEALCALSSSVSCCPMPPRPLSGAQSSGGC